MKKYLSLFFMTFFMIAGLIVWNPNPVQAETTYTISSGTLTISGSGDMTNYTDEYSTPWYNQRASIKKIVISSNVTSIGDYAFCGMENVTSVSIPKTVTLIGRRAFYKCQSLSSISIPSSVTTIYFGAFSFSGLTSVSLPSSVTWMGNQVFYGCSKLTQCYYSSGMTTIPPSTFMNCSSLTSFQFPSSITKISSYAFNSCTSLSSITIRPNVTYIGARAFADCSGLKNIYFVCNAPTITDSSFANVTATADYISYSFNKTWDTEHRQNYGGTITWCEMWDYYTSCKLSSTSFTYDGSAKMPSVMIRSGDYIHVEGVDYEIVRYEDNVDAGTGRVYIYTKGIWGDHFLDYKTFTISKSDDITLSTNCSSITTYPGVQCSITATASQKDDSLQYSFQSSDSKIATVTRSSDNVYVLTPVSPGSCTITVTIYSKNYNEKEKEISVTVRTPTSLSNCTAKLSQTYYTYDGTEKKPLVEVTDNTTGKTVSSNNLIITYSNNKNAGVGTVTITGRYYYTGSLTKTFQIGKAEQSLNASISSSTIGIGKTAQISVTGKLTSADLLYSSSDTGIATVDSTGLVTAVKEGSAVITVTAPQDANCKEGAVSLKITVKKNLSSCKVSLSKTNYTFCYQSCKPTVILKAGDTKLVKDTDYTVTYKNNYHAGQATVTITGIGDYTGSITKKFTIKQLVPSVTLSATSITKIAGDASFIIEAETDSKNGGAWYSQDEDIATVDQSGRVTLTGLGATIISFETYSTASESDVACVEATCEVWVKPAQITDLKATNSAAGIKLTWSALPKVSGYEKYNEPEGYLIYRKTASGSYTRLDETLTNEYVDKTVENGKTYYYKVRAYSTTLTDYFEGAYVYAPLSAAQSYTFLTRPTISSATNASASSILVKWNKNTEASGYQIQYSTSSNFSSAKTVTMSGSDTVSREITGLTKGKTYYVRIHSYKTVDGIKKYSTYSSYKKVTVTK